LFCLGMVKVDVIGDLQNASISHGAIQGRAGQGIEFVVLFGGPYYL